VGEVAGCGGEIFCSRNDIVGFGLHDFLWLQGFVNKSATKILKKFSTNKIFSEFFLLKVAFVS
jgi:hypothetical protein